MKRTILTVIGTAALLISAAQAAELTTVPTAPVTPVPGSPGTATPTPYPQITPRAVPKPGNGSQISLPPIELPQPPKDEPLPGLKSPTP